MFGIGPMELIVIAIFAIIFIGPQNLPHALGKFARFFVKARRYSSDIKVGFDDMVRKAENEMHIAEVEANLKELKQTGSIDEHSLKPLKSQGSLITDGKSAAGGGDGLEHSATHASEAELYAGLPSHVDGKPIHPFDEDEPEPDSLGKGAAGHNGPESPSEGKAAQKTHQEPAQEEGDHDHHEKMIKSLQDKLADTPPKS